MKIKILFTVGLILNKNYSTDIDNNKASIIFTSTFLEKINQKYSKKDIEYIENNIFLIIEHI